MVGVVEPQSTAETPVERNFEDFFMRVHARAIAHAERFLDYDDAREAVQAAAIGTWKLWSKLPPEKKDDGYFIMAVHNRVIDALRRQGRYEEQHEELTEDHDVEIEVEPPPVEPNTGELWTLELLDNIVAAMPIQRREVWTLVMVQGFSYTQAAELLKLRYPTIGRHMTLAKETVRKGLLAAGIRISAPSARQMLPGRTGGTQDE